MHQLSDLLQRLIAAGVEFVLVGGYAAVVHGVSFVTRDVDVCLRMSPDNLMRLEAALEGLHPKHRMTPDRRPLQLTPEACANMKNLYLETDCGILDCLGEVLGIGDFDAVKTSSQELGLPFGSCRVLDLAGLIKAKEAMDRPHDRLTVMQLKAIQESKKPPG